MKKLLLALLAVAGVLAVAPRAEAGQFARVYSDCGSVAYVHKSQLYGNCYSQQVARNNARLRYERALAIQRANARRFYYGSYGDHCAPRRTFSRPVFVDRCDTRRAPRVAFAFGF